MLSVPLRPSLILVVATCLVFPTRTRAETTTAELDQAWNALANNRPETAARLLDRDVTSRSAQLARAAALMGAQPVTDGSLRDAEQILMRLEPGTDEIAAQAAYLHARIYELHLQEPDYAKAANLFATLATRLPESHWAQLGLVKLALMKLYVLPDPEFKSDPLAAAEAFLPRVHELHLQRDLHLAIGQAGISLKQPLARLLPHLVQAEQIGGISSSAKEDLLVQIGVLSFRAGQFEQAVTYFHKYLAEYPNNVRAFNIKEMLGMAEAKLGKEKAS